MVCSHTMGEIYTESDSFPLFNLLMDKTRLIDEYTEKELSQLSDESIDKIKSRKDSLTPTQLDEVIRYTRKMKGEEDVDLFFAIIAEYHDYTHRTTSESKFVPYGGKNTNRRVVFTVDKLPSRLLCMLYELVQMRKWEHEVTLTRED